jgi:hypothetical protein
VKSNLYRTLNSLLWLALPLTALRYWMVWDRLPARMATHFDAAGDPNGWMSREASLGFGLLSLAVVLVISAVVAMRVQKADASAWAIGGVLAVVTAVLVGAQEHTIRYNLSGESVPVLPLVAVAIGATFVFIAVYMMSGRGHALTEVNAGDVIAEERHTGRLWAPLFLAPLIVPWVVTWKLAGHGPRMVVALVSLLVLPAAAFAWDGFHYRITRHGLEIRTLGFRLRSIPATEIESYEEQGWNPLRGYGIRGICADRAYVWGGRVVRVHTLTGDVYLGHSNPDRLVNDLDRMRLSAGAVS